MPYYFLGIIALGVHGFSGLRAVFVKRNKARLGTIFFWWLSFAAIVVASAIMFGLVCGSLAGTYQRGY